jgi:hypothetical protein
MRSLRDRSDPAAFRDEPGQGQTRWVRTHEHCSAGGLLDVLFPELDAFSQRSLSSSLPRCIRTVSAILHRRLTNGRFWELPLAERRHAGRVSQNGVAQHRSVIVSHNPIRQGRVIHRGHD